MENLEEVRKLAKTPCDVPDLKNASLFSCLTGLRISDILALTWSNIEKAQDGGWCIRIRTEKTDTEATLPLTDEAYRLCGNQLTQGFPVYHEQSHLPSYLRRNLNI